MRKLPLSTVTCSCGKSHFVVFHSELIICKCNAMINVEDERYGILPVEQSAAFIADIKHETEYLAANTQTPPGVIHNPGKKEGKE